MTLFAARPAMGLMMSLVAVQLCFAQESPRAYSSVEPIDPFAAKPAAAVSVTVAPETAAPAAPIPLTAPQLPIGSPSTKQMPATTMGNAKPAPAHSADLPTQAAPTNPIVESQRPASAASALAITLTEPVIMQERPFYHGSGVYALGGLVGGLIALQVGKDEPDRIAAYVRQENIHFEVLVKNEFERQINAKPEFLDTYRFYGPATFRLNAVYGITSVPFSDYRPYLSINAQLIDAAGTVKWKNRDYIGARGKAPVLPYPDFFKSVKVFQTEFDIVIEQVVGLILNDFHR